MSISQWLKAIFIGSKQITADVAKASNDYANFNHPLDEVTRGGFVYSSHSTPPMTVGDVLNSFKNFSNRCNKPWADAIAKKQIHVFQFNATKYRVNVKLLAEPGRRWEEPPYDADDVLCNAANRTNNHFIPSLVKSLLSRRYNGFTIVADNNGGVGVSVCGHKDVFNKQTGLALAYDRLKGGEFRLIDDKWYRKI